LSFQDYTQALDHGKSEQPKQHGGGGKDEDADQAAHLQDAYGRLQHKLQYDEDDDDDDGDDQKSKEVSGGKA
jgi:hypothetical protein